MVNSVLIQRIVYSIGITLGPALITLVNLDSGRSLRFGRLEPEVLERSFST